MVLSCSRASMSKADKIHTEVTPEHTCSLHWQSSQESGVGLGPPAGHCLRLRFCDLPRVSVSWERAQGPMWGVR